MSITVVRYRPRPETAELNQRLVEAVYTQPAGARPEGLSYTTFRLADGTFLHIADHGTDGNPLNGIPAFADFVQGIEERCEPGQGPRPQSATVVGSYRSADRP